jgi:hypothetical protein
VDDDDDGPSQKKRRNEHKGIRGAAQQYNRGDEKKGTSWKWTPIFYVPRESRRSSAADLFPSILQRRRREKEIEKSRAPI